MVWWGRKRLNNNCIPMWLARQLRLATAISALSLPLFQAYAFDSKKNDGSVDVVLGEVRLSIPRKYVLRPPLHEDPERPDAMGMAMLFHLPDFSAVSQQERRQAGWGEKIHIALYNKGKSTTGQRMFDILNKSKSSDICARQYNNYCIFDRQTDSGSEILFEGDPLNVTFFLICTKDNWYNNTERGFNHSCNRVVQISDNAYIDYSFSRKYIDLAKQIESMVLLKLNSFRYSGPLLEGVR